MSEKHNTEQIAKRKKKSMKQQTVAASSATRAREPYQHRPRHIKSSNSCYYATHSQPSPSCVCVWLCVVSSRPCKTGEPNKNNAECMQYIRCEHKIHLNIYMKSIWDHIFFFILTKCILQWWVTTVDSYSERREPSQKDTGLIGVRCQFIDKSILICNAFEVGCCWSNALFRSHHLRLESYVTWL